MSHGQARWALGAVPRAGLAEGEVMVDSVV
jgi:hypothetical protein